MHVALLLVLAGAIAGSVAGYLLDSRHKGWVYVAVGGALGGVAGLFATAYLLFAL
jgi:hypothetical protein